MIDLSFNKYGSDIDLYDTTLAFQDPKIQARLRQLGFKKKLFGGWVRGKGASASKGAIADGLEAYASGTGARAIGAFSIASGNKAVASGDRAKAYGNFAVAVGVDSCANGHYARAYGPRAKAYGNFQNAAGANARAYGSI